MFGSGSLARSKARLSGCDSGQPTRKNLASSAIILVVLLGGKAGPSAEQKLILIHRLDDCIPQVVAAVIFACRLRG